MAKGLLFHVDDDLHRAFKAECARRGDTVKSALVPMVEAYIKQVNPPTQSLDSIERPNRAIPESDVQRAIDSALTHPLTHLPETPPDTAIREDETTGNDTPTTTSTPATRPLSSSTPLASKPEPALPSTAGEATSGVSASAATSARGWHACSNERCSIVHGKGPVCIGYGGCMSGGCIHGSLTCAV